MKDFGRLIKKASANLTRRFNHFASHYGLTAVQMSLIDFLCLHQNQEIDQRDIEHEFLIRRSTASALLKRMENRGLVSRQPSRMDARQRQVKLTPKSLRLEQIITRYMHEQQRQINRNFSPDEVKLLNRLLNFLANR